MDLKPELLKGMYGAGFERPSPIQQRALVPILRQRDVIVQAQSGTGKTSLIAVAALQSVDVRRREIQVLVMTPTREIAQQLENTISLLSSHMSVLVRCCVGGTSVQEDLRRLEHGVHVVVGTVGRISDMIQRGAMRLSHTKMLVLDEADEMLGMSGFQEHVMDVWRHLPATVQGVVVSATMPPSVLQVCEKLLSKEATRILVPRDELSLECIRQFFVDVEKEEWKFDTLCDLYDTLTIAQAVIFVSTRKKVEWLAQQMRQRQFTVCCVHGEMDHREREEISRRFRAGDFRVLLTTDLWARGIDVRQVSLVINYDLPRDKETYLHRIGRSGRYGRRGVAVSLITREDKSELRAIEKFFSTEIKPLPGNINEIMDEAHEDVVGGGDKKSSQKKGGEKRSKRQDDNDDVDGHDDDNDKSTKKKKKDSDKTKHK